MTGSGSISAWIRSRRMLHGEVVERVCELEDALAQRELLEPAAGDARLPVDGAGRVCVAAEVDDAQRAGAEVVARGERPQSGLERMHDVAGRGEPVGVDVGVAASCDGLDLGRLGLVAPRLEQLTLRDAAERVGDHRRQEAAAVDGGGGGMVVRDDSAALLRRSSGERAKRIGTGASRMIDPLPALRASTEPENGSRVRSNAWRASAVAMPMSKQRPVLE